MIDKSFFKKQPETIIKTLRDRGYNEAYIIDFVYTENKLRETLTNNQTKENRKLLDEHRLYFPNIPSENCIVGKNENDNKLLSEHIIKNDVGSVNTQKDQTKLFKSYATEMSGKNFVALNNKQTKQMKHLSDEIYYHLCLLDNFDNYYIPFIVNREALIGTGQLPKFENDLFSVGDDKFLIPTGEVPLTNLAKHLYVGEELKLTTETPCFRKEAGAAGKLNEGLIRNHQFMKREIVIAKPYLSEENSFNTLTGIADNIQYFLSKYNLSSRIVDICTGDLGFAARRTLDVEVWYEKSKKWVELSSISDFGDFQSRRIGIIHNKEYANTFNASFLPYDRLLGAILERY